MDIDNRSLSRFSVRDGLMPFVRKLSSDETFNLDIKHGWFDD
jgi:hypothetical protein